MEKRCNKVIKSKHIQEFVLLVENTNGDFSYKKEYGGKHVDAPLLMASTTKLFTTTCILILQEQGKLSFDDKVVDYFESSALNGLHVYNGQDFTSKLTIGHLLFQTSGLPDAYEEGKESLKSRLLREDIGVTFEEMLTLTKAMKTHFSPGTLNRAHYADINFDILGEIIVRVTDSSLQDVYKSLIFEPLGLTSTYLPISEQDFIPRIYYKDAALSRPEFIKSCRASGGAISTARELMLFLKAFFGGKLFNTSVFHRLGTFNKLQLNMYPIQYGCGYMRIPLHGLSTLFMGKGELVGHAGSTGSFAFYYPEKELFFVGDVNQSAMPMSVRLPMQLAISLT